MLRKTSLLAILALAASVALAAPVVLADWTLNNSASTLNFMTTKNSSKVEVHQFRNLAGALNDEGLATLTIDLNSVETQIPIRNERMQQMLFRTMEFPDAEISLEVAPESYEVLKPGDSRMLMTEARLSLHGVSKVLPVQLRLTRINEGLMVQNVSPVLIAADDFKLSAGVEALREIAKLASITTTVPVSFTLLYETARH